MPRHVKECYICVVFKRRAIARSGLVEKFPPYIHILPEYEFSQSSKHL